MPVLNPVTISRPFPNHVVGAALPESTSLATDIASPVACDTSRRRTVGRRPWLLTARYARARYFQPQSFGSSPGSCVTHIPGSHATSIPICASLWAASRAPPVTRYSSKPSNCSKISVWKATFPPLK